MSHQHESTQKELLMNQESIVDFPTNTRIHVALAVSDVERSRAFYEALLGQQPAKVRDGYVKFEVLEPPLNLSLNRAAEASGRRDGISHFGIQVKSTRAVVEARDRLVSAGLTPRDENGVTCCFAVQDKFWLTDPDGHEWEFFVVLANADVHSAPSPGSPEARVEAKPASGPVTGATAPVCCVKASGA
jgi:catechol 2,3-dioxygenase-like lactoylglutathione lyase family enzyme